MNRLRVTFPSVEKKTHTQNLCDTNLRHILWCLSKTTECEGWKEIFVLEQLSQFYGIAEKEKVTKHKKRDKENVWFDPKK